MKIMMEIRAGEGGEDAWLLRYDQANIYMNFAKINNIKAELIEESS